MNAELACLPIKLDSSSICKTQMFFHTVMGTFPCVIRKRHITEGNTGVHKTARGGTVSRKVSGGNINSREVAVTNPSLEEAAGEKSI